MKIKYGIEWWSNESGVELVKSLMDNGDWEYDRLGIGEDEKGLFIVDVDDCGEEWRSVNRVKKGLSVENILEIGVESGVLVKIDDGYDEDDEYRFSMDSNDDKMEKFGEKVLENGKFVFELYSFMEE